MDIFKRFHPSNLTQEQCILAQKIVKKYMLGIFICRSSGDILYSFQIDPILRVDLISQFICALSMFGEENIGKIKRIFIEGLDIELNIIAKYDLIVASFFRPNMVKDYFAEEAEYGLDLFYEQYQAQIKSTRNNQAIYQKFDNEMCQLVHNYLQRLGIF